MSNGPLRVGRHEVSLLLDGSFEAPIDVLTHEGGILTRQSLIDSLNQPTIKIDVNCFALCSGDGITLIDVGTGTAWGPKYGFARVALRELGIAPEQVNHIVLTHIHGDHALGLFDGETAYFPEAEVLVPQVDFTFFTDPAAFRATPEARRGGFAVAEQLKSVYGSRIRMIGTGSVLPGIEARLMPGHTPGHTGYLLSGEDDSLLIWGDALHLGDLQPQDPGIGLVFDLDAAIAVQTRRAVLDEAATEGWIIAGSHITGFGRVRRVDGDYKIVPV